MNGVSMQHHSEGDKAQIFIVGTSRSQWDNFVVLGVAGIQGMHQVSRCLGVFIINLSQS